MHRSSGDPFYLVIVGGFFALSGAWKIFLGFGTNGWRPVQGEITSNFLSETEERDDDDEEPWRRKRQSFFEPRVMYKYSVRDREYECDCLQEGLFRLPFKQLAQKRVEGYSVGQRVTVYVSPRNPAKAVLKRGPPLDAYLLLIGGLIILLVGWKFL